MKLKISTPQQEGIYQGSKWLKLQLLCSREELKELFSLLEPFWIFPLTGVRSGEPLGKELFLEVYGSWIERLKKGEAPPEKELRTVLAAAFVREPQALWLQEVPRGYLVKIAKPVLQVQAHFFTYSSADGVFRPMSFGEKSIFWGLQFAYPQIYQDAKTQEICKVEKNPLFEVLRRWVREATRATPFLVEGTRVCSPIRLGKSCFSWITAHPQLQAQKIEVSFHAR